MAPQPYGQTAGNHFKNAAERVPALFGIIAQPIIPAAAKTILDALGIPQENRNMPTCDGDAIAALIDALPRGLPISPPDVLFQKIEDEQIAAWTAQFGGE